jgi:hypothetical protein
MRIGSKSLIYGAHQVLIHPIAIAYAWTKLYGFPLDLRLWCAFLIHDWGYWGKSNMDGESGERHPVKGAAIMRLLFGKAWGDFTLLHSRFYATKLNRQFSRLAVADKLASTVLPAWLYVPMVCLTGEADEYMHCTSLKEGSKFRSQGVISGDVRLWYSELQTYLRGWVEIHKDVNDPLFNQAAVAAPENSAAVLCR